MEINPGEIIALTGKSGSGKTSIAMAILGMLPNGIHQQSGTITFASSDKQLSLPTDQTAWSQLRGTHIGFTQQDVYGAFDPIIPMGKQMTMIVAERSNKDLSEVHHDIRLKMEEAGLSEIDRLWNSYPHQLSGGQLQRCQIAMAVAIQPALLITDEPTSAIDKINQAELLDLFAKLREKYNMAILCITHEEFVVKYLADREIRIGEIDKVPKDKTYRTTEESIKSLDPVLVAEDLKYNYRFGGMMSKEGAIIGPLHFGLQPGTCLGIIGESGSGKSTLAQLLVGLLEPTSGKLMVKNAIIDFSKSKDIHALRKSVQLVMQDGRGSLHPHFTIRRLLREVFQTKVKNDPEVDQSILKVLGDVGLKAEILDRKPVSLSGGECLRVSIARALLLEPAILVCDESTSALDAQTRDGIIGMLKHLVNAKSLAIIFISHDEYLIRQMSDQLLVLAEGKVVEQGSTHEVVQYPTHPATKKIFSHRATLR